MRTKKMLKTTFEKMLGENDYNSITIKELSLQAGINRKTFYSHYSSLDELLVELQQELLQDIRTKTDHEMPHDIRDTLVDLYRHICYKPDWYRKLLCTSNNQVFAQHISNQIIKDATEWFDNPNDMNQVTGIMKINYIASSFKELYNTWYTMGCTMPVEDFISFATSLICDGCK